MNAIIYTTNTGSTEHYAKLLAQKTGLPVYSLAEAKKRVFAGVICTPFTGHPVEGVLLCGTHMSTKGNV